MLSNCKRLTVCAALVLSAAVWLAPLTAPATEAELAGGSTLDPNGLPVAVIVEHA